MDRLLELSGLVLEGVLTLLTEPLVLLGFLLLLAVLQWLVLRYTRRRGRALRWLTLLPVAVIFLWEALLLPLSLWSLYALEGGGWEVLLGVVFSFGALGVLFLLLALAAAYLVGWGLGWLAFWLEERVLGTSTGGHDNAP